MTVVSYDHDRGVYIATRLGSSLSFEAPTAHAAADLAIANAH